jgi:hypothetical protein
MDLSLKQLQEAIVLRRQIDTAQKRLASLFGAGGSTSSARSRSRRPMSAATRAKLAAAARARWATRKGGRATTASKSKKKRGGITAAGRKKLSEMMKARWAARRKAAQTKKK